MKWLFMGLCFLLLLLSLEPARVPRSGRYAFLWQATRNVQLVQIFPAGWMILVERGVAYLYRDGEGGSDETYVPAVRLDNGRIHPVWNHRYLWKYRRVPRVLEYTVDPRHPGEPSPLYVLNRLTGGS